MTDHSRMMNFHSSILQVASIIKNNEQKKTEETFEMEKKKRERKANYTREETDRLVALIITKKDILENKKNGADQWQEKKQAWEDIERAFNRASDGYNYRDSKNLRVKYECLKRDIRKKWSNKLAGRRDSNGKLPKFSSAEKKIKEILQLPIEEGFCDFNSMNDKSDGGDDDNSLSSPSDSNTRDPEWTAVKKEIAHSDEDEASIVLENENHTTDYDGEPPNKRIYEDPLMGMGKQRRSTISYETENRLIEEKLEVVRLQKELLKEEIEVQKLKKKMMAEEMLHKRALHELETKHLSLKIEALKNGNLNNSLQVNN